MRIGLSITFVVVVLLLGVCTFFASRSHKPIGKTVAMLCVSLIVPVLGNLFIISSPVMPLSITGCYLYFIGMNLTMFGLTKFTLEYCSINKNQKLIKIIIYSILILDSVQILVNLFTNHVFIMETIEANLFGNYVGVYNRFIPKFGLYIHRVIDYSILAGVLVTLIIKAVISPKVYAERYLVILFAMIAVAVWETFYILSRLPIDISMIGFGVFGGLVFLLALYYRPLRLLDRMLAAIASKMTESICFFDTSDRCIWVNNKALELLELDSDELDKVTERLIERIGDFTKKENGWKETITKGSGDEIISFAVEKHAVSDSKNRVVGSYLLIRDNSVEQKTLERETYNANHDALTKALNRAGYDAKMNEIDLEKCFLLLIDLDAFKATNDEHGHTIGDKVLIKIVDIITDHFRKEDYVCRIGGDEFAVIIPNANGNTPYLVKERVDHINKELTDKAAELPLTSISAGGAFGKDAENSYELFNNADHALYETKFNGKCGFTLFKKR